MKRISEFFLGLVAIFGLGFAAYWLATDIRKAVVPQTAEAPQPRIPTVAEGWFPSPQQPVFGWEDAGDTEGWLLEADAPLEWKARRPLVILPEREDHEALPDPEPVKSDEDEVTEKLAESLAIASRGSNEASKASLQVPVDFPDPATIYRSAAALRGVRYIAYDVYVPEDARGFVGCLFFLKDKDGLWYQARARQRLLPGKWTTIVADISGGSPDVTPLGHLGQWDENQATQIRTIGITFYGDRAYKGHVCVDHFRGWMRAEAFKRALAALEPAGRTQHPVGAGLTPELQELGRQADAAAEAASEPLTLLNLRTDPLPPPGPAASPPTVGRFETFTVRFELNRQVSNPFDPEQADVRAAIVTPKGEKLECFGFWFQDYERAGRYNGEQLTPVGRPEWRVRFTPRATGEYKLTVRVQLKGEDPVFSPELAFVAAPSPERGFVRVSPQDPNYFELENGSFFYPVGFNFHTPVDVRCWSMIFKQEHPLGRGLPVYENIFPKMAAAGQNVCEVWMAAWWVGIEWTRRWPGYHGPGRYSLENAWKLDRLLAEARKHGIYIHLALDNHGKFSEYVDPEWEFNPYNKNSDGDGVVTRPSEFFTSEDARALHKRRLRYIAARWAGETAIMGWELVSEFNLVGNGQGNPRGGPIGKGDYNYYKSPQARAWVREMLEALRAYDPYERPVTNHFSGDFNVVDRELATSPAFDYIVGDGYREQPGFAGMALGWYHSYGQAKKPHWVTEFGGFWNASSPARLEADMHTGLWSSWMTNAGAAPLFWWYDFLDRRNLYPHYRAFTQFIKGEDKRGLKGWTEQVQFAAKGEGLAGLQYRWSLGAYAWIYNEAVQREVPARDQFPRHEGVVATVPGLTEGPYRIEFWDTYTGKPVLEVRQELAPGANLALQLPPFRGSLAIKVKRAKPEGPARAPAPEPSPATLPPPAR